jgi:Na+/H+-dicarboxylate symporter
MQFVMSISPFFVFCLMAGTFSKLTQTTDGLLSIFSSLGWYAAVILLGFFLMLYFVYPLMLYTFGRQFPLRRFFTGIRAAQVVGFSTSSSVATLPISLKCVKDNLGVSTKVANFVLPIGATVNMDGTSLYQGAAVIFLAQFHGIDLSWEVQLTVLLATLLTSIGASGIPSAGLILLIVILESIGLDPYWIAIIAPIDRLIDMLRTVVNLTGDAMVAVVLSRHEKKNILDAIF